MTLKHNYDEIMSHNYDEIMSHNYDEIMSHNYEKRLWYKTSELSRIKSWDIKSKLWHLSPNNYNFAAHTLTLWFI